MKFSKLQATGNDFILVDGRDTERDWAKLARDMCQRHFGVGADGLLVVKKASIADLKMRVFNPDGSEAEVCGNGLRCFVKYAIEVGIVNKMALQAETQSKTKGQQNNPCLTIETLAGIKKARAYMVDNKVTWVEVNMGMPRFRAEQIPIREEVAAASELLGLDPLEVTCEGKAIIAVRPDKAEEVLKRVKETKYGRDASIIGEVKQERPGYVIMETLVGGRRIVEEPYGEPIPRVC